jgi:transposase
MNTLAVFVGLDYHQDSVQVSVLNERGEQLLNRGCRNDWKEISQAIVPLGVVKRAAIEACCGAADLAEELVNRAGWHVDMAHPQYVARMKQSPDKTDFSDGRMLADLTRVGYLPTVWLPSAGERDLRQLVNHRQNLVDQRRATKLRIGAVLREHRAKPPAVKGSPIKYSRWSRAWINWVRTSEQLSAHARWIANDLLDEVEHLDKKVLVADARLREATQDDSRVKHLMQEPEIGEVTAWTLRAFVGRFDRFTSGKQLSRYCGLSPCNASSGARQSDSGLVRGCNRLLRATLIQAAHRLVRSEARWMKMSDQMSKRGKPVNVIVAAVANRWMRGLWHRMKEQVTTN